MPLCCAHKLHAASLFRRDSDTLWAPHVTRVHGRSASLMCRGQTYHVISPVTCHGSSVLYELTCRISSPCLDALAELPISLQLLSCVLSSVAPAERHCAAVTSDCHQIRAEIIRHVTFTQAAQHLLKQLHGQTEHSDAGCSLGRTYDTQRMVANTIFPASPEFIKLSFTRGLLCTPTVT